MTAKNGLKTAAAYIRVSTEDQVELSPDSQLSVIRDYARREGYLLPEEYIFVDEGISGRKASKRDAFIRMVSVAKSPQKPFDAILLWTFSRFARNQEESIVYKSLLRKKLGIDVISVSEPLADGVYGSLIERIIEWMDEYYSIRLSDEVKRSMTVKAQRGELQAAPSFGYKAENNLLVPVPEEAEIVKKIFDWFINGEGCYPIARKLNDMGIRTHRGSTFENRTVEYIIQNPVYIGKLRWNPAGRTRRNYEDDSIIISDARHEPLIDIATWEAAQKRMDELKEIWTYKARPTGSLKDWLSGLVRCSSCGATLVFAAPHYFKCNNYLKGKCTKSQHVHIDILHGAVLERLEQDTASRLPLDFMTIHAGESGNEEAALKNRLKAIAKKQTRIKDAYLAGVDSLEDYRKYREVLSDEEDDIKKQLCELAHQAHKYESKCRISDNIRTALKTLNNPAATIEEKNGATRRVFESCIWNKETKNLKIIYRLFF